MKPSLRRTLVITLLASAAGPAAAGAQDIELLGRIHGTRPPQAYYDLLERDPGAFQFRRALLRRGLGLRDLPEVRARGQVLPTSYDRVAQVVRKAPDRTPVTGTFNFPLILGLFSDSPPVPAHLDRDDVQAEFFDGPQANDSAAGTIPEFYHEISGGRVVLTGTTFDWRTTNLIRSQVTAGVSGLGPGSRVGEFIVRILEGVDDGSVDWGHFDNDGPDGIPNSGDDDGYVDVLAIMHPTPGGECSSGDRPNRIWSHRWDLWGAAYYYGDAWTPSVSQSILTNNGYVTEAVSANDTVPFIKILDYTIQPVLSCGGEDINYIGVFAHELGHGFGLPDLYVTSSSQSHEGAGNWGLMGTGSWGCDGGSAWSPCHMTAWSKEVLGWGEVETLDPGADLGVLSLPPVETTGKIYRIDAGDGSGEYLLLENRQPLGFDQNLYEPGLLVWHVDPEQVSARWPGNTINNDPDHMGVWLRQADGLNELGEANGGRGDAGDPFPGLSANTVFHAGSQPGSWSHEGGAMGVTLLDIAQVGETMSFRAYTRYQTLTVRTETVLGTPGLVSVDGVPGEATEWETASAPFQHHVLEAEPGEPIGPGERWGFVGWLDEAPRIREHTTGLEDVLFTATYGGTEYLVDVEQTSSAGDIVPGTIEFDAGDGTGWIPQGQAVTVQATPRTGFQFLEWAGALAGQENPASITVTEPVEAGAVYDVTFSAESNDPRVDLVGGMSHSLTLEVVNANLPVRWSLFSGSLPAQVNLTLAGTIIGTPMAMGEYPVTLRVVDAIGLQAYLPLTLAVTDPEVPVGTLAAPFLLTGPGPTTPVRTYLDREGNDNGAYDLGDFRAYVLRNPGLEAFQDVAERVEGRVLLGDRKSSSGGEEKRKEDRP